MRYSYLQALWMSFYSGDLYRDVVRRWDGIGFLYLLLLSTAVAAITGIALHSLVNEGLRTLNMEERNPVREWVEPILDQVPPITIKGGVLSAEVAQPYTITAPSVGGEQWKLAVIDTTGKTTSPEEADVLVVVTAHDVRVRKENHYEVYSLNKLEEETGKTPITFDRNDAHYWFEEALTWIKLHHDGIMITGWVSWLLFAPLGIFIAYIFKALGYSLAAMLFAAMLKQTMDYPTLLRLSCVAITPVILGSALAELAAALLNIPLAIPMILTLLATLGVLFFAMQAATSDDAMMR